MQLTQANREYNTCAEHSSRPFQNQTAGGGAGPETSSSFAEKWLINSKPQTTHITVPRQTIHNNVCATS